MRVSNVSHISAGNAELTITPILSGRMDKQYTHRPVRWRADTWILRWLAESFCHTIVSTAEDSSARESPQGQRGLDLGDWTDIKLPPGTVQDPLRRYMIIKTFVSTTQAIYPHNSHVNSDLKPLLA